MRPLTVGRHQSGYRPDIDGLRAVAVVAVVAYHAFPSWLGGGFAGVDVFFVISGFLITGIIRAGLAERRFSLARFYARRVRRLFPALIVVFAACWAIGWVGLLPGEYAPLGAHMLAGAAFVANFSLWSDTSYFSSVASAKPMLHLWSLGIEEQFYIFWPAALIVLWRWRRPLVPTLLLCAASFAWCLYLSESDPTAAFYSPLARMWELLAGASLALVAPRLDDTASHAASLAGALLIVLALLMLDPKSTFPGWRALAPVVGACLILAAGPRALLNRALLARPILVGIGLISYPLYLWHWPVLSYAYLLGSDKTETGVLLALVAASVVLAWATYRFVELPIRGGPPSARKIAGLAAAMAAMAAVAAFTVTSGGFPGRLQLPEAFRHLETGGYDYEAGARWQECWVADEAPVAGYAAQCRGESGDGERPSLLLWGDSQAARLYPALPRDVAQFTRNVCPPVLGLGSPSCQRSNEFVLREIARLRPSVVLMFANWADGPADWRPDSYVRNQLELTLAELAKVEGTRVVFLGPSPQWNRPLPRLLIGAWQRDRSIDRPPERLSHGLKQQALTIDRYMAGYVGRDGVRFVSLIALLCTEEGCRTRLPGSDAPITWNLGHFTVDAARFVIDAVGLEGSR